MSDGFYTLKVQRVVAETADAKTFFFDVPQDLLSTFVYTPGQYLTFEAMMGGEKVRRSYSLCTYAGQDSHMAVTVKRVDGGRMSNYMNDHVSEGSEMQVMAPMGKFTMSPEAGRSTHYVLFAGGSGITPMMGISKAVLKDEPNSQVTLVYANRNPESVIFKETLANMEKEFSSRFKVIHSYDQAPFTWFGLKGLMTEDKVSQIVKSKVGGPFDTYQYFICGPAPMMDVVKKGLGSCGISGANIHTEYFTAPSSSEKPVESASSAAFSGQSTITMKVYGKTHTISCDDKTTVLNAAMKQGIDPPYSCTVGVCTTCRAKVHSGELHMLEREGLSDDEIKQGYVLTCQSVPRSAEISLSYE